MSAITANDLYELGSKFEAFKNINDKTVTERLSKTEATFKEEIAKAADATLVKYDELKARHEELKAKNEEFQKVIDAYATAQNRIGNAYSDGNSKSAKRSKRNADLFNRHKQARWGALNGSSQGSREATVEDYVAYRKAFVQYAKRGKENLDYDVMKTMAVGSDPDGGFWILPPTIANHITTRVYEGTPLRELANVETIGSESLDIPQDPNDLDVGLVSETGKRTESNTPPITQKRITAYEIYAQPKVTLKFLEDANTNIESWLSRKLGDKFSRYEGTLFTTGTGAESPRGFLTYPAGTNSDGTNKWFEIEQVGSGSSGVFTYLGLIKLMVALKEPYHNNATWFTRRAALPSIMTLVDGNGRLIFQPILSGKFNGAPLLGYDLRYAADMPAPASGSKSIAFGDWNRGYTIVDRVGMTTRRDDVTEKGFVKFWTRKRVGGDVDDFDAIKIGVLS